MNVGDFEFIDAKKFQEAEYLILRAYEKLKLSKELSKTKFFKSC